MRLIRILVEEEDRDAVTATLDERDIDYVFAGQGTGEGTVLLECPVPTDAVGEVLSALEEAGHDPESYTVIGSVESASTPNMDLLMDRYAEDFDPLSQRELRSKARDMSNDPTSFYAMMLLSAIIATAGLLTDSPAVVVGSMVIAPIVGPALTASVGVVAGDRRMIFDSVRLQALGLAAAIAGATAFALFVRFAGFAAPAIDITSIELISVRLAPTFLALVVGVAAGAAAAFGLVTKGPTSLIGVMIAAALVPAAAASGIAVAWNEPRVAVGTAALLVVTIIAINLAALAVLGLVGYRPPDRGWLWEFPSRRAAAIALVAALLLSGVVLAASAATAQQVTYERSVNVAVDDALDDPEYEALDPVATRNEYGDLSPFTYPPTVTVVISKVDEESYPDLAATLEERIAEETGRDVTVRVRFLDYKTAER